MTDGARRTCFIHIGPPKTGSSSIKHFIWNNEALLDELGLYFPKLIDREGRRARNHEQLATVAEIRRTGEVKPNARAWPEIEAVAKAGEKDILLSSEMFARTMAWGDTLDRTIAFFERYDYRVVFIAYVRDQPAWLNSWYMQSQKRMAHLTSFDAFAEEAARLGRVEPARYLAPYFENPRCEVVVVSFEQAIKTGLEQDFLQRCGIAPNKSFDSSPLRNSNAGAKTVYVAQEILRRLDAPDGLKGLKGFGPVYNAFKRRARRLDWDETPYVALDQDAYDRIRAQYAESNEVFAKEHFGVSWTELCPPRTFSPSVFDPAKASARERREVEAAIAEVSAEFQALRKRRGGKATRKAELVD